MLGSGGRIEVAAPLTDDERRDYEIHVHGQYGFGIAAQMKSVRNLRRQRGGRARYMHCMFPVRATRIVNSPYFWYFIARLDIKLMRLDDPVFLNLFQGLLCLFLLEMGMTASRKLKDLKRGGVPFIILGIAMPIVFSPRSKPDSLFCRLLAESA